MATINISLQYPQVQSATKRIEKNQANVPLRVVKEITVKGKLLALNNQDGYSAIWQQIDAIEDSGSGKNCTLSFGSGNNYSNAKIINISFENSNNQDIKSKDFSITFETYEQVNSSLLTTYGVQLSDLKDISDIKASQDKEENLEGETLTTSISITFAEHANIFTRSKAATIANSILATLNILSLTSPTRTTSSNIYDETVGTYTFIKVENKFRTTSGISFAQGSVLISTNYNIQTNGSILVSENGQFKFTKNQDQPLRFQDILPQINAHITSSSARCNAFIQNYYNLCLSSVKPPSNYYSSFIETEKQITIDQASRTAQYTFSMTNEIEYDNQNSVKVEIITTIEDLVKEKSKRKILRGTITGIKAPPDKNITPNKKLENAKAYFDQKYKNLFDQAKTIAPSQEKIGDYKTYATNGEITYNISEGSISFNLTYEDRPEYDVLNQNLIYGSAEITEGAEVHLANQFIVIGGAQPGKELIQETAQSKPVEKTLRVECRFKSAGSIADYIKSDFKELILNNYQDGILTALSISSELVAKTFQGSATWLSFGKHRERSDVATKVILPTEIKL